MAPEGEHFLKEIVECRQFVEIVKGQHSNKAVFVKESLQDQHSNAPRAILNFREFAVDLCGHVDFLTPTPSRKRASAASSVIDTQNIFLFPISAHARLQLCLQL